MLKSTQILEQAKYENRRYFSECESSYKQYEANMDKLYKAYEQAKANEERRANRLKKEFEANLYVRWANFYTEIEIKQALGAENFLFMREMRLLECCGQDLIFGYLYTPTWL